MRAMILAAGRGERMRPLTDHCPKPLLDVGGEPMIVRLIRQIVRSGITDLVINHAWLGKMIETRLGDGSNFGANIRYSPERVALETAGGIANARMLLGEEPFLIVNGDLVTDFDFALARRWSAALTRDGLLGIGTLVSNPRHNPQGDFSLRDRRIGNESPRPFTWAGIAVITSALLAPVTAGAAAPLAPLLRQAAEANRLGGHVHAGQWSDVGTPERLRALNESLA